MGRYTQNFALKVFAPPKGGGGGGMGRYSLIFVIFALQVCAALKGMVKFVRRFDLKTGIDFAYFGLNSGNYGFRENMGVYEHIFFTELFLIILELTRL